MKPRILAGAALTVAFFAAASPRLGAPAEEPEAILDQVVFPAPDPLGWLPEIDELGNILVAVEVDAIVVHDGGSDVPQIVGMDIRGSRCSRSVYSVMARSPSGPWTVICLPREFGLYEKLHREKTHQ